MANRYSRVLMSVCPGEKVDGSGRVCIHLFVRDERGPFTEPHVLHHVMDAQGRPAAGQQLQAGPARGRLACSRTRGVAPQRRGAAVSITSRTDDPRAVTCPKCLASPDYREMLVRLSAAEAGK